MTYKSRGRSMVEVLVAVTFVCFLAGFVMVLCIGNYYRAKRAMERQKHRRLARLTGQGGNGVVGMDDSPRSVASSALSNAAAAAEQQRLLGSNNDSFDNIGMGTRRRPVEDNQQETLLMDFNDTGPRRAQMVAV